MDCQGWRVSATSDLSAATLVATPCIVPDDDTARGEKYRHVFDSEYRSLLLPLADSWLRVGLVNLPSPAVWSRPGYLPPGRKHIGSAYFESSK